MSMKMAWCLIGVTMQVLGVWRMMRVDMDVAVPMCRP